MGFRIPLSFAGLAMVTLLAASCGEVVIFGDERIRGSGTLASETRAVSGFDEVAVFGFGEVFIDVNGTEGLTVEADENLLPYLTTEVSGGRLELGVEPNYQLSPTQDVVYHISAAALTGITVRGSGDVKADGVNAEQFSISITGSGDVATSGSVVGEYAVAISGSGDVEPSGTSGSLDVQINGSGDYHGEGLVTSEAAIGISGSGSAVVNATEHLSVRITGSGDVEYLGNPTLDQTITGSGDIRQR